MYKVNRLNTEYSDNFEYFTQFLSLEKIKVAAEKFGVKEVTYCRNDKNFQFLGTPEDPIFEFDLGPKYKKMYRPNQTEPFKKHFWLGERPKGIEAIFGINQIPPKLGGLIIFDSFLDSFIFNASQFGNNCIYSIGLDGPNGILNNEILEFLEKTTKNITLFFRNNPKSQERAKKLVQKFGLKNFEYSDDLKAKCGNRFGDILRLKLYNSDLIPILKLKIGESVTQIPKIKKEVKTLLDIEEELNFYSENEIDFPPPLLSLDQTGIIYANALNVVQGKMGSFKSRFSASLGIQILNNSYGFLGLTTTYNDPISFVYVDTERSLKDEFASALKNIKVNLNPNQLMNFRYTSLKKAERKVRYEHLGQFINEIRSKTKGHIFIIIDVITDAISNSNDLDESYKLIDKLGNLTEDFNATVLAIIHENPGSDKARGHLGTELGNKSSSLISIGYDKNKSGEDTDFVKIRFLKNRNNKRPAPIYCKYSEVSKRLELVTEAELKSIQSEKREKAAIDDVVDEIQLFFEDKETVEQKELIDLLKSKFEIAKGTATTRLDEIVKEGIDIVNPDGIICYLEKNSNSGKTTTYKLMPKKIDEIEAE